MLGAMETQKQPVSIGVGPECEHGWATASQHHTSLGTVSYRECVRCGAFRVELQEPGSLMPAVPLTRAVAPAGEAPVPGQLPRHKRDALADGGARG